MWAWSGFAAGVQLLAQSQTREVVESAIFSFIPFAELASSIRQKFYLLLNLSQLLSRRELSAGKPELTE